MSLSKIVVLVSLALATTGCAVGSDAYTLPTQRQEPVETFSAELRPPDYMNVDTKIDEVEIWSTVDLDGDGKVGRPGALRDVELMGPKPNLGH
jgi:hypothetical protein